MASQDVLLIGILIFVLGIGFFLIHNVINTAVDSIVANPVINQSNSSVMAFQGIGNMTDKFDYMILIIFIGLALALVITGFLVGGLPIFMAIYMIIIFLSVIISAILSNVWESLSTKAVLISTLSSFPITNHILLYLPVYITILGFVGIVVMFGKPYILGDQYG